MQNNLHWFISLHFPYWFPQMHFLCVFVLLKCSFCWQMKMQRSQILMKEEGLDSQYQRDLNTDCEFIATIMWIDMERMVVWERRKKFFRIACSCRRKLIDVVCLCVWGRVFIYTESLKVHELTGDSGYGDARVSLKK